MAFFSTGVGPDVLELTPKHPLEIVVHHLKLWIEFYGVLMASSFRNRYEGLQIGKVLASENKLQFRFAKNRLRSTDTSFLEVILRMVGEVVNTACGRNMDSCGKHMLDEVAMGNGKIQGRKIVFKMHICRDGSGKEEQVQHCHFENSRCNVKISIASNLS